MRILSVLGLMAASVAVASLPANTSAATKLDSEAQKLGYIIGMDIGASLKQQGSEIDLDALFDAVRTTYAGETPLLTPEEAATIREAFIAKRRGEAEAEMAQTAAKNAAEGDKFLLENRTKEGVQVTASGLQYQVIDLGTGPKPAATDKVRVHYRGTLLNGEEFDSSYARGEPISFELNKVIPGWTEGVQLMPVGSKFMFYIPSALAYGPAGGGPIGPNSTLIFQVELLGIEGQQ
jgi:FKBP-type peptidyl-prolyl cis-trans isomerase FkpA